MKIGVPWEYQTKITLLTPQTVGTLAAAGHEILMEPQACELAGFTEEDFQRAGVATPGTVAVYQQADIVMKASAPQSPEYHLLRRGQILVGFLNVSSSPELVQYLVRCKVRAIDLQSLQSPDGTFPILESIYEIAGKVAVHIGAQHLLKWHGGRGVLLGGVSGVPPATVVVVGGGTPGISAAMLASRLGAHVILLEPDPDRVREMRNLFGEKLEMKRFDSSCAEAAVREADLLIGAMHSGDREPPTLVTEDMVRKMKRYSVIVDVAPEHGSCIETLDRTVETPPAFQKYNVLHCSVPYIYRMVPRTSSFVLSKAILPYILELANKGFERAVRENQALAQGVCVADGRVTNKRLAEIHGLRYTPLERVVNLFN